MVEEGLENIHIQVRIVYAYTRTYKVLGAPVSILGSQPRGSGSESCADGDFFFFTF